MELRLLTTVIIWILTILVWLPMSTAGEPTDAASDTSDDDDQAYSTATAKPKILKTNHNSQTLLTLGNLLAQPKRQPQPPIALLSFNNSASASPSDDYPPYPGSDYSSGTSSGSYSNSFRPSFQKVVYIAIPVSTLISILTAGQLRSIGFGTAFPPLPPVDGGGGIVGGAGIIGGGGSSYVNPVGPIGGSGYVSSIGTVGSNSYSGYDSTTSYGGTSSLGIAGYGTNLGAYGGGTGYSGNGPSLGSVLFGAGVSGVGYAGSGYNAGGDYNTIGGVDYGSVGVGGAYGGATTGYGATGVPVPVNIPGPGVIGSYGAGGSTYAAGSVLQVPAPPPIPSVNLPSAPVPPPPPILSGGGAQFNSLPCPRGAGYYRHPVDCNRFYRCVNTQYGIASSYKIYEFNCPPGLVYSILVWVCVWPYQTEAGACYVNSPPPVSVPVIAASPVGPVAPVVPGSYGGAPPAPVPVPVIPASSVVPVGSSYGSLAIGGLGSYSTGSSWGSSGGGYNDDDSISLLSALLSGGGTLDSDNNIPTVAQDVSTRKPRKPTKRPPDDETVGVSRARPRCSGVGFFRTSFRLHSVCSVLEVEYW